MITSPRIRVLAVIASMCAAAGFWRAGARADAPAVFPKVHPPIDFVKEIAPIFETSCMQCHAHGRSKGGLRLDTRADLIKGGESNGPVIVPGHADQSLMISLVTDPDNDVVMPKTGKRLTTDQIQLLKAWIDQGAAWPDGFIVGHFYEAPIEPRRPAIPAAAVGSGVTNPIDLLLQPYFAANGIKPDAVVDDRTFARRVFLDVVGLLPTPAELDKFLSDASVNKRAVLVDQLLADNHRYAENWLAFWNDLLRNDYKGTGFIDGGRHQITGWLYHALESNMPYDRFVRELVTGSNGCEGFVKGIVWRGVVNASQTPQMQAAQNVSQVFMGINLKCASCHDSFVSNWKLTDSYGLASVYSDTPLELQRCDHPLGTIAYSKFLYSQLGTIDAQAPREQRVQQLGTIMTDPRNGRLTRTIVNRLWQRCMGVGLIEPTDDMDAQPWDADLLDELAVELPDHHYDLKQTLRTILTSRAYQMPAAAEAGERDEHYVFRGPVLRRMTAEQFSDAVSTVTGVWMGHAATQPSAKATTKPATQFAATEPAGAKPAAAKPAATKPADNMTVAQARASICPADPLTVALGRPNREQVVTERTSAATTLQGLELANGRTLSTLLQKGARQYLSDKSASSEIIVDRVFTRALGRMPNEVERQVSLQMVGSPATPEGVEDLIWDVFMLPEFQLIR